MRSSLLVAAGFAPVEHLDRGGVYVLLFGDEVVYIGQSDDVPVRVTQHRLNFVVFTDAFWVRLPKEDRDAYEGALMRRFNPALCTRCLRDESRDLDVLTALGLDPDPGARLAFIEQQRRRESRRKLPMSYVTPVEISRLLGARRWARRRERRKAVSA